MPAKILIENKLNSILKDIPEFLKKLTFFSSKLITKK